jgi:hypothetical protein
MTDKKKKEKKIVPKKVDVPKIIDDAMKKKDGVF